MIAAQIGSATSGGVATSLDQVGRKDDRGKPRLDLIPPDAMVALAQVLGFGASKYAPHNWERGMDWSRVIAALHRHLAAFEAGIDRDEETGLPHIDHALCCVTFLSSYFHRGIGTDDRWKQPEVARGLASAQGGAHAPIAP